MEKRAVSGILLILLLTGTLTLAFSIQPEKTNETIYMKADVPVEGENEIQRSGVFSVENTLVDPGFVYKGDIPIVWDKPEKPFDFWGVFISGDHTPLTRDFDKDATDMRNKLDEFVHWNLPQHKRLLLNATWNQVQTQGINWLKQMADDNDVVVLYYSGHGIRISDADPASSDEPLNEICQDNTEYDYVSPGPSPMDEGISLDVDVTDDDLGQAFEGGWKSDRIGMILIFDSCYSGGMIDGGKDPGATLMDHIYITLMAAERNWLGYVRSGPSPQNSEFTYYLLEGLTGLKADVDGDGVLTAEELFDYADPRTRASVGNLNEDTDSDGRRDEDPLDLLNDDGDSWADENGDGYFNWNNATDEVWLDNDASGNVTAGDTCRFRGEDGELAPNGTPLSPLFNEDPPDTQKPSKSKNKEFVVPDWWPMYGHDLRHTRFSNSTAPNTNNKLWNYTTEGAIEWSSPAVFNDRLYIGSQDCKVYCLNATTGALLWSYATGGQVHSSPAVTCGKVFIGSYDGKIYALNATTGALIWSSVTDGKIHSSPAVADGKVFIASDYSEWPYPSHGTIYAFNATTGQEIWRYRLEDDSSMYSSPAIAEGKLYVGASVRFDNFVCCLNATTGAFIWSSPTAGGLDTGGFSSPTVSDYLLYVGGGNTSCLDTMSGCLIWRYETRSMSSPAVAYGLVFIGGYSNGNKVFALNATYGSLVWSYPTEGRVYSSPAVADGKVYVGGGDDRKVYCLNAKNGVLIWRYTTGSSVYSSPAIADGNVYIGSCDDNVYAFGLPAYDATIKAHCNTEGADISVSVTMDGNPTGYNTPHTFTGLRGSHTFTVPSSDASAHSFRQWSTGATTQTITVTSGGTYTAYYQAKYTLTITTTTAGTTTPAPGTYTYWDGTVVSVTATPYANCLFHHWELDGNNAGAANPISVTMNTNHALYAVFVYSVTIEAYCYTEAKAVGVSITMNGNPTGYNTPHTFTGLTGTHTFTVPSTDASGHPFAQWSTGAATQTITVSQGGTYTAYYYSPAAGAGLPHVDKLLIKLYSTESAEFAALEAGEIDLTDWPLTKYWITRWTGNPEINMMDYGGELGAFQIDINQNATKPDSSPAGAIPETQEDNIGRLFEFRHAVAHLVNRPFIIANVLEGFGAPMYTMVPPALGGWVNPAVRQHDLWDTDLPWPFPPAPNEIAAATAILDTGADGIPWTADDIRDWDGDGYRDWPLTIYPTPKRIEIDFVVRDDHTPGRKEIGDNLIWQLTSLGFYVKRWSAWGSVGARKWVQGGKSFTLYTGGWTLGTDPDFLFSLYHSSQYWHPGRPPNYANINNPALDTFLWNIKNAQSYAQAMANTQAAQAWMAQNVFVIPVYASSAPKAVRTGYTGGTNEIPNGDAEDIYRGQAWNGFQNEFGFGVNSWWSFLNAHPQGFELPVEDKHMVLRYGFKVPEVSTLNPVYSDWYWDMEVMDKVYERLIRFNPLNPAEDLEWIAKRWEVGTWTTPWGDDATKIVFELRNDVFWHDGQQLDADDLVFTLAELDDLLLARDLPPPWFYSDIMEVYDVTKVSQFKVEVRFNVQSYFALHSIGEAPILPEHVWRPIIAGPDLVIGTPDDNTYDPETFAPDKHLIGAGPFKVYPHSIAREDWDYYVPYWYVVLDAYRGYFNSQPIFASMATHGSTIDVYLENRHHDAISVSVTATADGTPLTPTAPGPYTVPACSGFSPGVYVVKLYAPPSKGTYGVTVTVNYNFGGQSTSKTFFRRLLAHSVDGDVNNDGAVNVLDAVHLIFHWGLEPRVWPEDDANADNYINIVDAIIIMQHFGQTAP